VSENDKGFEFLLNRDSAGAVRYEGAMPENDELLYLVNMWIAHDPRCTLVQVELIPSEKYDGGRSGKIFVRLHSMGTPSFTEHGDLRVPEKSMGELRSWNNGGVLVARNYATDAMARAFFTSERLRDRAHADLRAVVGSLKEVFTGLQPKKED